MDLSAIIFLALFVAWAIYLVPKALSRHDDMAKSRSVDGFSDRMRVLADDRKQRVSASTVAPEPAVSEPVSASPAYDEPVVVPTRASAARAARRRRRVLYALLVLTVAVAAASFLSTLPKWTVAIPLVMIGAFLVIARRTVRRDQARRTPPAARDRDVAPAARVDRAEAPARTSAREEQLAEVADPLADEGSLWDPLPMTLPTYVDKAPARRTVRTIELGETSSSGHDAGDSALAAEARKAERAESAAEHQPQRKAAGA